MKNPNDVIDKYARSFFDRHVKFDSKSLKVTDNAEINDQIYTQFCRAFVRNFYGIEIGQENPLYFLVLLRNFCEKYLPIFAQGYKQLFIDNMQWLTNISDSKSDNTANQTANSKTKSSAVAGQADTPQDELNFKINTGDPTEDYNFNYSSEVNGSKSNANTDNVSDSKANTTTHTQGRNAVVTELLNGMLAYTDGIYFDLFTKAKNDGLFMFVY